MKKSLTSLILGTALALSITPLSSKTYALENKTVAEDSKLPSKDEFTFDDFKQALGKRYETLSEAEKKQVKQNFFDEKFKYFINYNTIAPSVYQNPKKIYEENDRDKKEIDDFKIRNLSKEKLKEYLEVFPWIKEKDFQKIDNTAAGTPNPDKILIYASESIEKFRNFNLDFSGVETMSYFFDNIIRANNSIKNKKK